MKVPIRTLTQKDAEIMARASVNATVSKGYVERHGLRWTSHALVEWERRQRNLVRPRDVEVLIDELDLSSVYVVLPSEDGKQPVTLRALSTQPRYTQDLSLYEHEKVKASLKLENLKSRLVRMEDPTLYAMRIKYYALLGRQDDPVSARRLEKLRDQLTERSIAHHASDASETATPAKQPKAPTVDDAPAPASATVRPLRRRRAVAQRPSTAGAEPDNPTPQVPEDLPEESTPHAPEPPREAPPVAAPAISNTQHTTHSVIRIKRKHR